MGKRNVKVLLWRHGQTDWNIENRFQGHSDIPLNDVGLFQVSHAAKVLAGMNPTKIISSDLIRTRQTAAALSELTGFQVRFEEGLRETNGGNWEGHTGKENRANDGERFMAWLNGSDEPAGEIGERRSEVAKRAMKVIERELENFEGLLIVVTHGGAARSVLCHMLELPQSHWATLGGLSNASWSVLEPDYDGKWTLSEHNSGSIPEPVFGNESVG
jgi:broad specificity phosphatase PhoE